MFVVVCYVCATRLFYGYFLSLFSLVPCRHNWNKKNWKLETKKRVCFIFIVIIIKTVCVCPFAFPFNNFESGSNRFLNQLGKKMDDVDDCAKTKTKEAIIFRAKWRLYVST